MEDHGIKVLIDPAALMHVIGTKMDFITDRIRCATPLPFSVGRFSTPPPPSPLVL